MRKQLAHGQVAHIRFVELEQHVFGFPKRFTDLRAGFQRHGAYCLCPPPVLDEGH